MEPERLRNWAGLFFIMAKSKTLYVCQNCGANLPKWQGQCPRCEEWNALVETTVSARSTKLQKPNSKGGSEKIQKVSEVRSDFKRVKTGIFEFDRALGGGIVPGSINLLAGEPGIGKSTLLLQVADAVSNSGEVATFTSRSVLYVCGEESPVQIKSRAKRLGLEGAGLMLLPETDVDVISETVSQLVSEPAGQKEADELSGCQAAKLVIIDSVQTITTEDLSGGAGSIGQVRECADRLRRVAKKQGISIILVGHVTKSGNVAGPKVLEHLVDGVFSLEGDKFHAFRILRASKNRFGSCFEVGVFEMGERGLEEVENPSALFLSERSKGAPGSVVTATLEGTRPVLVEIQSLASPTKFKYPRRSASGFSGNRLELLCAVLEKRAEINLQDQDIYVNVASGMRVSEPAADLGVVLSLASTVAGKAIPSDVCAFGEVGLSGEVRNVSQPERRDSEAERLGFDVIIAPPEVRSVKEALSKLDLI